MMIGIKLNYIINLSSDILLTYYYLTDNLNNLQIQIVTDINDSINRENILILPENFIFMLFIKKNIFRFNYNNVLLKLQPDISLEDQSNSIV